MSLTRDEWLKMWNSVKCIESITTQILPSSDCFSYDEKKLMKICVKDIKDKIQQVIGQME